MFPPGAFLRTGGHGKEGIPLTNDVLFLLVEEDRRDVSPSQQIMVVSSKSVCWLVGLLCVFFPLDDRVRWTPSPGKRNGQSRGDLWREIFFLEFPRILRV
jgi:hypothetical protein